MGYALFARPPQSILRTETTELAAVAAVVREAPPHVARHHSDDTRGTEVGNEPDGKLPDGLNDAPGTSCHCGSMSTSAVVASPTFTLAA